MDSISNEVFDIGYDFGAVGGPKFNNTIIEVGNGYRQINVNWSAPLRRWQVGERSGDYALTEDEKNYITSFFYARRGSAQAFKFRDWTDYRVVDQVIAIGAPATNPATEYSLFKRYGDTANEFIRPIKRLIPDTFSWNTNKPQALTITPNNDLGTITLSEPLVYNSRLTCSFHFYTIVRFVEDELDLRYSWRNPRTGEEYYDLGKLSVIEERVV
jgi:uncharacterized protein (TIGR02217 family)